jgi:CPA2 family monovalent cation:H+ antiporter-2
VTLAELAVTVSVLAVLGLVASRVGLSAIPAYLLAGLLLGPNEPEMLALIEPSEVTDFVAEIGLIFLLFFIGLEFSLARLLRSGHHFGLGGTLDLLVNGGLGLIVGIAAFGWSFPALILATAVYVSSSAITGKGLIDFRRLADEETDLVLAILIFEDLVLALVLGLAAGGGSDMAETFALVAKVLAFVGIALAASRWLARPLDRLLDRLSLEFFLLFTLAFVVGMAALAEELELSGAIGALMAGIILAETTIREQIEERFFSFRDVFAALFFFAFGLSIDVGAIGNVAWLLAAAVALTVVGKIAGGYLAGIVGGFTRRQSLNAGIALIAHGEFTIILAQIAADNEAIDPGDLADLSAFAGLYVLVTATIGLMLMKESKRIGRSIFPPPTIPEEA